MKTLNKLIRWGGFLLGISAIIGKAIGYDIHQCIWLLVLGTFMLIESKNK
jgi:hypothetical protein